MGRDRHRDKGRLAPFVPLLKETLATPAWRAMSHGARSLYVSLKLRYSSNFKNNDQIYLSIRDAAKELGSHKDVIGRWFRELQHYGFIVMTSAGCLGVEGKGKAPHWRLTEIGHMTNPPTRDFLRWNGAIFQNFKKQNPVPKSGDRVSLKVGTVVSLKVGTVPDQSVPKSGDIQAGGPVPKSGDITRPAFSKFESYQAALSSL
jgi:hypothetical protein